MKEQSCAGRMFPDHLPPNPTSTIYPASTDPLFILSIHVLKQRSPEGETNQCNLFFLVMKEY